MRRPFTIIILVVLTLFDNSFGVDFEWSALKPGDCTPNNATLGLCTKSRVVNCVEKTNGQAIPEYYCLINSSRVSKPSSYVACDVKECSQHCIVSKWSMWHPCDAACSLAFRYRTRSILWKDQTSASCPTLIDKASCARCAKSANQDFYLWQVTNWGTCRHFKTIPVYQLVVNSSQSASDYTASSRLCGPSLTLGRSTRRVRCVDRNGQEIKARKCLNGRDKQGRITQRPEKNRACQLSCDCNLSGWSQWSACPQDCSTTEERRTRDVLYAPRLGGKPCGTLEETRACATSGCPRYEWYGTPWRACQTQNNPGILKTQCGNGFQERLVFCIKSSAKKSMREIQPVEDNQCDYTTKLVSKQPCHRPCPDDCKVSEWHEWEACSTSCGKAGVKKRKRTILQAARNGGAECPNLVELSPCGQQKCVSWSILPWSPCFLPGPCGSTGQNTRLVYCREISGIWKNRALCSKEPPKNKRNCSIPCPNDCVLSEWSNWGSCSKSCGTDGGIKTRYRRIVAYPSIYRSPCPAVKELVESQKCNQYTFCEKEVNFKWKVEHWSQCQLPANGTCGIMKGVRTRTIHCGTHMQNFSNSSYCPQAQKPADVQRCDIPCSKDCIISKWQEWSKCKQTCGLEGVQIRMRYILQESSNGGVQCPPNMTNGVEKVVQPCAPRPLCYTYTWNVTEWDRCVLLSHTKSAQATCGAGYHTRNISCLRSDQKLVKPTFCYESLLMPAPTTLKTCWKPCADYCVRSSWTPWSSCPSHCDPSAPRYRQRTRQVINLSPARGGWSTTCPHLTAIDFTQIENCPTLSCYSYKWHEGVWGSCLLNRISSNCGYGQKERNVLCERSDHVYVSDAYCSKVMKPVSWQSCFKDCTEDCIISSWGQWTKFSNSCGDSIQKRSRTVLKSPIGLGKACPSLTENQLYHDTPCLSFKWSSDLWSTCKLSSNNTICGNGTQTRRVVCLPDATREENCLRQAPKPASMQSCFLPCPGDCVWSRKGDIWGLCGKTTQGCIQNRWRYILRKASTTSTKQCVGKTQETRSCDCPQPGKLVVSEWSTCQLNRRNGPNCGKGVQFRSVKCVGANDQVVNDALCSAKDTLAISQDCHAKCPVDCILAKWGMWSVCSKDCGLDGVEMRSRNIIVPDKNGGRKCPDQSDLVQKRPCNGKPCYTYMLEEGKWSKCNIDGGGCGYGTKTREALCRRSDEQPVHLYYCFEQLKSFGNGGYFSNLNIVQALLNNISKLSISTKQSCIEACPGNCMLSEWSDWSQCGRTCFQTTAQSFQSRSRVIISKPIAGGKACSTELLQTRSCQSRGSNQCIGAEWKTGTWQTNGTRVIWCETSIGINVTGACVMEKMPLKTKLCDPVCSDPNAMCTDGKCVCKQHFEHFQDQCIPHQGCLRDAHCVFKNTVCKAQKCECKDGHIRNKTTGPCVQLQTNGSPTSTSVPTGTVTVTTQAKTETTTGAKTEATTGAKTETTIITKPEAFLPTSEVFLVNTSHTKVHLMTTSNSPSSTAATDRPDKTPLEEEEVLQGYWKWVGIGAGALLFFILLIVGFLCYTRRQRKSTAETKHKEKANPIELVGILSLTDGEKTLPAKV